ncbi:MAG: cysteine hydrolase [Bacillota bacterium]|nr:cysteine hydrolase [Bacillota bacterium]
MENNEDFIKRSSQTLLNIRLELENEENLNLDELEGSETAIIIIDMVNGFTKTGALKSERIEALIPKIELLMKNGKEKGMKMVSFADYHTEDSLELKSYPPHCMEGSTECDIVSELKEIGGYELIHKNSTNGFMEDKFIVFLNRNRKIKKFIIVGDCSDICILQFTLSLKSYFDNTNRDMDIFIPYKLVDTFDLGDHYAPLYNIFALKLMKNAGVKIVKDIIYR